MRGRFGKEIEPNAIASSTEWLCQMSSSDSNLRQVVDRSDTGWVSIDVAPDRVWECLSDVRNAWPSFSPFAERVYQTGANSFTILNHQGSFMLATRFDRARGLLDHIVRLAGGAEVFVPYRVVPNNAGSTLIMTNVKLLSDTDVAYDEQVAWMHEELKGAKRYVEERCS